MNIKILSIILDSVLILLVFLFSFLIRFPKGWIDQYSFSNNISVLPFIVLIFLICLSVTGGYRKRFKSFFTLLTNTLLGLGLGTLISMNLIYVFRSRWGSFPSSIFLIALPINCVAVVIVNWVAYKMSNAISKKVVFIENGALKNVTALLKQDIDEIVLTAKSPSLEQLYFLLRIAEVKKAKLSLLPKVYDDIIADKINEKNVEDIILPAHFKNATNEHIVRCSDIAIASALLFFSLPLMALISFLIALDFSGRIIYKQKRVGLNGKKFILYKFRSMVVGADQYSRPRDMRLEFDERVTKIGYLLRRIRLDELPQLYNVIKGDMSLVGPRPEAVYRVKDHRALQGIRLSVRPGLTGLAQIMGDYHTKPRHKLQYDMLYIHNRSLALNLSLVAKTIRVILFKAGS